MIRYLRKNTLPVLLGLMIAVFVFLFDHTATIRGISLPKFSRPLSCRGRPCDEEIPPSRPHEVSQERTLAPKPLPRPKAAEPGWVTALYWTDWFGDSWASHFGDEARLEETGCPEHRCHFTYDRDQLGAADFVFFTSMFNPNDMPPGKSQDHQHWVYSVDESPLKDRMPANHSRFFDMVQSYYDKAEIPGYNGYFLPIKRTSWLSGSNKMEPESDVFKSYMKALHANKTLQDMKQSVPPEHQAQLELVIESFEMKIKVAGLMTSHCPVQSGRLSVVEKLNEFLAEEVDVYGACGSLDCQHRHPTDPWCWENLLAPNYFFYLTMENSLCDEYITEKLYNPLVHGLVPVVYGGANYSLYLPPHSFIDVQQHTPQQLADLLQRISKDKAEYSRYHLWRAFWEPVEGGNVCATCRALHRLNGTIPTPKVDIDAERKLQEPCHPPNSPNWFPENVEAKT